MTDRITSYSEFWPFYLRQHSKPACRALHYFGTALALGNLAACVIVLEPWYLLSGLLCGYGFAWLGHFLIQKNRPATFQYPLWSLLSDFRMFFAWLGGRLSRHLTRAGVYSQGMARQHS